MFVSPPTTARTTFDVLLQKLFDENYQCIPSTSKFVDKFNIIAIEAYFPSILLCLIIGMFLANISYIGYSIRNKILENRYKYTKKTKILQEVRFQNLDLQEEVNFNEPNEDGLTPVHFAAKSLDIRLLNLFCWKGADLHLQTNIGDNLLILACKNIIKETDELKAMNLIEWLLGRGFKANYKSKNNFSPLHYASQSNHLAVIKILVKAGADIHAIADDNTNPLHSAAMSSNYEMMQYFVDREVEWYRRDNYYGFSLNHMAALSSNEKNFKWLIGKGCISNDRGNSDISPLHLAAMVGNAKVTKTLIQCGVDVQLKDKICHCTALHLATMKGKSAAYIKKIKASRLQGEKIANNLSLVGHCLKNLKLRSHKDTDFEATIIDLIKAGADVNARDKRSCTPLHYAARCDTLIEILLRAGAYIHVENAEGYTPLHNTIITANIRGLQSFLMFGANINHIQHRRRDIFKKVSTSENSIGNYVLKHILKLKLAGLPIDNVRRWHLKNFESKAHNDRCFDELLKLKKRTVSSDTTLYDLLHMNFKRRASLVNSLRSDLKIRFPHYYIIIKGKCNEAIRRISLMKIAKTAYRLLTEFPWPDLCIEHILSFLSNETLEVLIVSMIEREVFFS